MMKHALLLVTATTTACLAPKPAEEPKEAPKVLKPYEPKPASEDPALATTVLESARRIAKTDPNWQGNFVVAAIKSDDWVVDHHPDTGVVTGRYVIAELGANDGGQCYVNSVFAVQAYDGSGYSTTITLKARDPSEQLGAVTCESLEAARKVPGVAGVPST